MKHHHLKRLLTGWFYLLVVIAPCTGQEMTFNQLTAKDGLSSNFVNCVWQDRKGFLWVGTDDGLERYDGYHFFSPATQKKVRMPMLPVNQILGDNQGRMFIRQHQTVGIFDYEKLLYRNVRINIDPAVLEQQPLHMLCTARGEIFLVVERDSWYFYDEATNSFDKSKAPFPITPEMKVLKVIDDSVRNRFWLATMKGLAYYDKKVGQVYSKTNNPCNDPLLQPGRPDVIRDFFIDSRRRYWYVSWDKVQQYHCFDEKTNRDSPDTAGLYRMWINGYAELLHFTETSNDHTILAYGENFLAYKTDGPFQSERPDGTNTYGISFKAVQQVFEDRQKILWIATDFGLYNSMVNLYSSKHLVIRPGMGTVINALFETPDGDIQIGSWGQNIISREPGLEKDSKVSLRMETDDDRYTMVWSMVRHDATGDIWVGCQQGRLAIWNPGTKRYTYYTPAPIRDNTIRKLVQDKQGNIWMGTHWGEVFRWKSGSSFEDSSFQLLYKNTGIVDELYVGANGHIWVGGRSSGLHELDPESGKVIQDYSQRAGPVRLSSNAVTSFREVNDSIWCIAARALNIYNTRTKANRVIDQWNQQPIGTVNAVVIDNSQQVWFSTTNGIYKYNFRRDHLVKYSQWDGLITVSNSQYAVDQAIKLRDGKLVFGGNQNLVLFDPAQYNRELQPPPVTITGFRLIDNYLPVDSLTNLPRIHLNRNQNRISISFASISFDQVNRLTYQYKLIGADKDWLRADPSLEITYNLLPPGEYEFMVRAQNEEGVFSPVTSLRIVIHPPFWKTWWFTVVIALAIALGFYALHRLRIGQLMKVEMVRRRLARDLHDDMGSTLSTINILSTVSMNKLDVDNDAVKSNLGKISTNSTRIMEAMDDIVWSINPLNDSMAKIIARMKELAGELLEARGINYHFNVEESGRDLSFDMEARRQIFLIFKEAINNVAKYSGATEVTVEIGVRKKKFRLGVRDNGCGFDPAAPLEGKRGNGLKNMHKRAEDAGGDIHIRSVIGEGTLVEVVLPVV